jgi:2-dehydropantoate 2-reductase
MLFARGSAFTASMLRDLEAGGRVEADHIVGDMLLRARAAGADTRLLAAAYCHLQAYEARRRRGAAA